MDSQMRAASVKEALVAASKLPDGEESLRAMVPSLLLVVCRYATKSSNSSNVSADTSSDAASHCSSNQSLKYAESPLSRDVKSFSLRSRPKIRLMMI